MMFSASTTITWLLFCDSTGSFSSIFLVVHWNFMPLSTFQEQGPSLWFSNWGLLPTLCVWVCTVLVDYLISFICQPPFAKLNKPDSYLTLWC